MEKEKVNKLIRYIEKVVEDKNIGYDERDVEIATELLMDIDSHYKDNYSKKTFRKRILNELIPAIEKGKKLTKEDIEKLFEEFRANKEQTWKVYRILHGAEIVSDEPYKLGPFTLYNRERHWSWLENEYNKLRSKVESQFFEEFVEADTIIKVEVSARENIKAMELADGLFSKFEHGMRLLLNRRYNGSYIVSIFSSLPTDLIFSMAVPEEKGTARFTGKHANFNVPVQIPNNEVAINEYKWMWETIGKKKLNNLEKRLWRAIMWLGKGMDNSDDPYNALPQFVFALESLFNEDNMDAIASQLAEYATFILYKNNEAEQREKFFKRIKDIYNLRSKLAHGEEANIRESDLSFIYKVVRSLVFVLTNDKEFANMESFEELKKWVSKKKFS